MADDTPLEDLPPERLLELLDLAVNGMLNNRVIITALQTGMADAESMLSSGRADKARIILKDLLDGFDDGDRHEVTYENGKPTLHTAIGPVTIRG